MIGSFLAVVAYRLPLGISFVQGRSFCPACGKQLRAWDLAPIISYLALGGRCRYCGGKIGLRSLAVELFTGLLAVALAAVYGFSWQALLWFALGGGLVVVALTDWDTFEISNGLIFYLLVPALALTLLDGLTFGGAAPWLLHLIGFFVVALPLYLLTLLIPDCFGGGDIKLMAVCGLALGRKLTLLAFFVALLVGGVWAIYLLRSKKAHRKSHFAFGPALVLGLLTAILAGQPLLLWYLSLF